MKTHGCDGKNQRGRAQTEMKGKGEKTEQEKAWQTEGCWWLHPLFGA